MIPESFSVGVLHGWHGVLLGLLGSVVFQVCGWQDVGPGLGKIASAFWFLLALATTGCVIWLGIGAWILGRSVARRGVFLLRALVDPALVAEGATRMRTSYGGQVESSTHFSPAQVLIPKLPISRLTGR
jgi:hypothetical protein